MERYSDRAIEIINELHRERLDYYSEYLPLIDAANKLSAYEDTGLEPEQVISTIIDPESLRPRAHWEDVFQDGPCRWSGECSACKARSDIPPVILAHYCPHCGAKMEEALNGQ